MFQLAWRTFIAYLVPEDSNYPKWRSALKSRENGLGYFRRNHGSELKNLFKVILYFFFWSYYILLFFDITEG